MEAKSVILLIQFISIAVLFFELVFVLCQKPTDIQKYLVILIIAAILMFTGYNIELEAYNIDEAIVGVGVAYMGKPFVMLCSFLFICSFYKVKIKTWVIWLLNIIATFFCVIVFWNQSHFLYYASVSFDATRKYSPLILTRGPLYITYVATAVVYFISCAVVIIKESKSLKEKSSKRLNLYIIAMVLCGMTGYIVYLTGITGGYDTTMIGVFLSVLCMLIMFVRCRIFDASVLGKDQALEDSPTGLIVFDIAGRVSYMNSVVQSYLDDNLTVDYINSQSNNDYDYISSSKAYNIVTKPLVERNVVIGKAVEITDISSRYDYQTKLESEVRERTEKLANIQREVVASVANIIEARSVETGEHIKRTSEYSAMIARELMDKKLCLREIDEHYIDLITSAAPLHDIGKIAVPDQILLKPGKLTQEEFDRMKVHVDLGAEIIRRTMQGLESEEYIDMAVKIAQYHHEHWDGRGYTQSMAGEAIPLCARIVAVADCYDAITSERCYKSAISPDEAMRIIKSESGSHFDPMIVYAFESAMKKRNKCLVESADIV